MASIGCGCAVVLIRCVCYHELWHLSMIEWSKLRMSTENLFCDDIQLSRKIASCFNRFHANWVVFFPSLFYSTESKKSRQKPLKIHFVYFAFCSEKFLIFIEQRRSVKRFSPKCMQNFFIQLFFSTFFFVSRPSSFEQMSLSKFGGKSNCHLSVEQYSVDRMFCLFSANLTNCFNRKLLFIVIYSFCCAWNFCVVNMSTMLADIDATSASLGYFDGNKYIADPEALLSLKVSLLFRLVFFPFNQLFSLLKEQSTIISVYFCLIFLVILFSRLQKKALNLDTSSWWWYARISSSFGMWKSSSNRFVANIN